MTGSNDTCRVLTWNVHGCVGRDRVCDPDRVARVLEIVQPDICALQEIDSRSRATTHDLFAWFGELFDWKTIAAHTLTACHGHYGHLVMSRWPVESLGEVDLSVKRREPRKAIVGAVASPGGRIPFIAVHLGLLPSERREQLGRIRTTIGHLDAGPLIVLGDFNDFPGRGLVERMLSPSLEAAPPLATFPSCLPMLPLDRIWFRSPFELLTAATLRDARRVSDHLPLVATLRLGMNTSDEGDPSGVAFGGE